MDILDFRPLAIFIIEIIFLIFVLKRGKFEKYIVAIFIFFLAGYQFGEFMILTNTTSSLGFSIAFVSTTMLLPMGVLILEKAKKVFLGSPIFFLLSIGFGIIFFLNPGFVQIVEKCACFAKFAPGDNESTFMLVWGIYYLFTLTYVLVLNIYFYIKSRSDSSKALLFGGLITNFFIYPFTYVVMVVFGVDIGYATSVLCTMGLIGAFTITITSIKYRSN